MGSARDHHVDHIQPADLGATALIFNEVVAARQRRERSVAVAAQALIVYGQAQEAYQAVVSSDPSSRAEVPEELRDLASNLLVAAPSLFDDQAARIFLLQVDKMMSVLYATVTGPGGTQDPGVKAHLSDLMSQLQQSFEPLLGRFPPDYQFRIRAMS